MNAIKSLNIFALSTLALAGTLTSAARQLTPSQALENAGIYAPRMAVMTAGSRSASQSSYELAYSVETDDQSTVYVFNRPTGGYYVVAADDAVPTALLGYTETGEFNAETAPENIMGILEDYGRQVAYAASHDDSWTTCVAANSSRRAIEPMLVTRWGGGHNFARFTPEVDGKHCQTGCVATALGQIIYYHKYVKGQGTISYKASTIGATLSYDFNNLDIDFNAIAAAGNTIANETACNEISELLAACGHAAKMNYGLTSSSSGISYAATALATYLGYDKGVRNLSRAYFNDQQWEDLVYSELAAGRPVFYSGVSTKEGGHAFVCDGYDGQGYYHMNWGWEGSYNGYFLLSALDYRGNGYGFDNSQAILVGIRPATAENLVAPVIAFAGNMEVLATEVDRSGSVNVRCSKGIFNQSVGAVTVTFGVKLESTDGKVSYAWSTTDKSMSAGGTMVSYNVPASSFPAEGIWRMSAVVRDASGNVYDALVKETAEKAYYVASDNNDLSMISESDYIALNGEPTGASSIYSATDSVQADAEVVAQEVYTISGQLVGRYAAGQQAELAAGMYIVRQQLADGSVRSQKMVF